MNVKKKKKINISMFVFFLFAFCIFLLYLKFIYLSLSPKIDGIDMKQFAANRNTVFRTISAKRGTVYDTDGNVLAQNVSSYTIVVSLEKSKVYMGENYVHDVDETAIKLAGVLNADAEYFKKLMNQDRYQVELGIYGSGLTELKKDEILALGLKGITFIESQKRFYPNGDFASYIVGYAKVNEVEVYDEDNKASKINKIVGELGIEAKYDEMLSGVDGYLKYQQSRYGYKITGTKEESKQATNGNNIYLTIDSNIQRFVENAVKNIESTYSPEWTLFSVMDAKTGDILAFSSTPSFDPNIRNIKNYQNPLVTFTYEPGSTMKTYAYLCAIENNVYKPDETYNSGSVKIGEYTVNDWNKGEGWGTISFDKGYEYSSNVGIVNLLKNSLTKKQYRECLKKYGFGDKTDIELAGEASGKIDFNYEIEYYAAGYGQGITTTVIQQLRALTLISNNGKILKPHIVRKIVDSNNGETVYERKVEMSEQLIKTSTVSKMKELMYNVIHGKDVGSTGYPYRIDGFDIIGKTGTSQIYDNKTGSYLMGDNLYIFSFAGMYPNDNPEIIVYAAMKKPTWGNSSGLYTETKEVIQSISKYKNMFTEITEKNIETYTVESYTNKLASDIKSKLIDLGIDVVIIGDGNKITKQSISKGTELTKGDKIILITNSLEYKIPNLNGWSRKDVISLCQLLKIKYNIDGYGYVIDQSYSFGENITSDLILNVKLSDKISEEVNTNTNDENNIE